MSRVDAYALELGIYKTISEFLKKKYGKTISDYNFYKYIRLWEDWYKGYVKGVHEVTVNNGINVRKREIYHLDMAKRVAEDWASALLSEPVKMEIGDSDKSKAAILIKGSTGQGGVLGSNDFNTLLSDVLETCHALGTSAVTVGIDKLTITDEGIDTSGAKIIFKDYTALNICPISWDRSGISECAFFDTIVKDGKTYYCISTHLLEDGKYVIHNDIITPEGIEKDSLAFGIVGALQTGSDIPYFAIFRTGIANNINRYVPFGVSVYANALDVLAGCDETYDATVREVITGQRIVFFNKMLLSTDASGTPIVPNDVKQSYMQFFGDEAVSDVNEFIKEFHPELNTDKLDAELQNQLNMLSMKCGLGSHYYNFTLSGGVTATEYVGERQDFQRNAVKASRPYGKAIKTLIKAVLSAGREYLGMNVSPDTKIVVEFSDGFVEDDSKQREMDRADVQAGIMTAEEYRAKWYKINPNS